jgi:hypothetical protein
VEALGDDRGLARQGTAVGAPVPRGGGGLKKGDCPLFSGGMKKGHRRYDDAPVFCGRPGSPATHGSLP